MLWMSKFICTLITEHFKSTLKCCFFWTDLDWSKWCDEHITEDYWKLKRH